MTRHEIQILRAVGMVQAAVAATAGVSVRSVRRIEGEAAVSDSDTTALVRARGVGRPSIAAASTATIARWLEEDRALPSGEIVRRLQQEYGYRGGKSALYERFILLPMFPVAQGTGAREVHPGIIGEASFNSHCDAGKFRMIRIEDSIPLFADQGGGDIQDERSIGLSPLRSELHAARPRGNGIPIRRKTSQRGPLRGIIVGQLDTDQHQIGWCNSRKMYELLQRTDRDTLAGIDHCGSGQVPASTVPLCSSADPIERIRAACDSP